MTRRRIGFRICEAGMSSSCARVHAPPVLGCVQDRVSFVVVPNQSLSDRGAFLLYGALSAAVAICQMPFLLKGYWLVTIFSAVDLVGVVLGIHVFRHCQKVRREEIIVEDGVINIRRSAFKKPTSELRFACYGLQLIRSDDPDIGCRHLSLSLRGEREEIARDLSPSERRCFAEALWQVLSCYSVTLHTEISFGWALFTKGPYAP